MKEFTETATIVEDSPVQSDGSPKFRLGRIVAPTDFSSGSDRAVAYAIQLARRLGAKLTLLHVIPAPAAVDYPSEEQWEKVAEKKLAEQLAQAKLQYEKVDALQVTAVHLRDQIVKAATDVSADLLVMATHGYTGWKHFLFGSDAEKIVEHASCPVLVVR